MSATKAMSVNRRTELLFLWCLPVGLLVFTCGWILSGYFPPPSPAMSAAGFQEFFIDHADRIRIAITPMAIGGMLTVPFAVAITTTMLRFHGGALAYTQLIMGGLTGLGFIVPLLPLMAAAYRPESSPELIRMLHDFFWLPFVIPYWSLAGQALSIAAFSIRGNNPIPRWYAYLCVWCVLGMIPSGISLFFQTGPFSPRGLICLWVNGIAGYSLLVATFIVFRRAIVTGTPR